MAGDMTRESISPAEKPSPQRMALLTEAGRAASCQMSLPGLPLPNPQGFFTDNPREIRIICALAYGPRTREELDRIAGASNVPDAIAALRRKGLDIPASREPVVDRDQEVVYRGRYRFTDNDLQRTAHIWKGGIQ